MTEIWITGRVNSGKTTLVKKLLVVSKALYIPTPQLDDLVDLVKEAETVYLDEAHLLTADQYYKLWNLPRVRIVFVGVFKPSFTEEDARVRAGKRT